MRLSGRGGPNWSSPDDLALRAGRRGGRRSRPRAPGARGEGAAASRDLSAFPAHLTLLSADLDAMAPRAPRRLGRGGKRNVRRQVDVAAPPLATWAGRGPAGTNAGRVLMGAGASGPFSPAERETTRPNTPVGRGGRHPTTQGCKCRCFSRGEPRGCWRDDRGPLAARRCILEHRLLLLHFDSHNSAQRFGRSAEGRPFPPPTNPIFGGELYALRERWVPPWKIWETRSGRNARWLSGASLAAR